jgi:hypothetical protein
MHQSCQSTVGFVQGAVEYSYFSLNLSIPNYMQIQIIDNHRILGLSVNNNLRVYTRSSKEPMTVVFYADTGADSGTPLRRQVIDIAPSQKMGKSMLFNDYMDL